jgi:LCP family protein required for cell wall assembly
LVLTGCAVLFLAVLVLLPGRTNVLLLGIDYTEPGSSLGRSDTVILSTFLPSKGYVGMLSIPRDLWVILPGFGEDRINTAHFYAEAQQPGSGPEAALLTVRQNFGIDVDHYVRIRFEGFREIVDALGGVDIDLTEPMAGYLPGKHHLTGRKALAFVRNRQGSDDFFRMQQGQFLLKQVFKDILNPLNWPRLPAVILAITRSVETNLPIWTWPRLGLTLLRAGPGGIDNRTINREMTTPFVTEQGANVLLPNWALINPVLLEMFGQ